MLPASNRAAGQNMGFPDVCNTPVGPATAPIPYPNIAMHAQAQNYSQFVKVSMVNALNMGSQISMTSGDEGGVAHWTTKGTGMFTMGSPVVFIDRLPAITLTSTTMGNKGNNPVGMVAVPGAVNVLFCRKNVHDEDASALAHAMLRPAVSQEEPMPGGVLRLVIDTCSSDLLTAFTAAVRRHAPRAVLLDLRGCPGGDADAAARLASDLLPKGALIATRSMQSRSSEGSAPRNARRGDREDAQQGAHRREQPAHRRQHVAPCVQRGHGDLQTWRAGPFTGYVGPLVALVDEGTASAAELLVAALQHHRRALVVGCRTFGKQQLTQGVIVGGQLVQADAGLWQPPTGDARRGVKPDVAFVAEPLKLAWGLALELANG